MKRERAGKASAVDRFNRIGGSLEGIGIREETNMKNIIKKLLVYTTTSCILTSSYNVKTSSDDTIEKKQITTTQEDTTNYKIAAHRGFSSKEIENTKKAISLASKKIILII